MPPMEGVSQPKAPTCYVNEEAFKARATGPRGAIGFAPPIAATTYKVAVLRVDFPGKTIVKTFAQTHAAFSNFQKFYLENSYGLLTVTATVSSGGSGANGAYRMPFSHGYYADGIYSDYYRLVKDAVKIATAAGFNLSAYDHIVLYHAGDGAETTDDSNIWSVYIPKDYFTDGLIVGGKTFNGVVVVPETQGQGVDAFGTLCHEYGHQLGLPDLYNTSSLRTVVGVWSLMDYGAYTGSPKGTNPAHFDAWSKLFLGFSDPETISSFGNIPKVLPQAETTRNGFAKIPIKNSSVGDKEYFLLEYRRKSGADYDQGLPGEGLLIWHVDDSIACDASRLRKNTVNTGNPNYGVYLVPAASFVISSNNKDIWSKSMGARFTGSKASNFKGKNTGVEVDDISLPGGPSISMIVRAPMNNPAFAANDSGAGIVIAAGEGGLLNPDRGESAQIGITPPDSTPIQIKIYNSGGELVAEKFAQGAANNQTFITWDGKDSDGQTVGSGIYFVKIEGGGIDTIKKIAVIK